MISKDDSLVGESTFQKWPLKDSSLHDASVSDQLLGMLIKNQRPSLVLDCSGCQPDSTNCSCNLNAISFENTFAVFLLLEIGHLSTTKWCPLREVETDFFFCDAKRTHNISAAYICDGKVHCPLTEADELTSLCNPWEIRAVAVSPFLINILVAICCAYYLARQQDKQERKKVEDKFGGREKIIRALKLVKRDAEMQSPQSEAEMQKAIRDLPSILQLSLARISRNIEVKRENRPRIFFEPCLESIFAQDEEQQTAFFVLTKEDSMTSTRFKKTVFNWLEPKGTISKIKTKISKILPYKLRIAIKTGKEVIGNVVGMITIPAQDIKDVGTVVSLYSFQENILQGHNDRLDNFRLEELVINIAAVTAAIFLLRRLNSLADDKVEDQSSVCRFNFLGFSFNLHRIPYVTEAFLCIEAIKESLHGFKKREAIKEKLKKLENKTNEDETSAIWKEICATSEEIVATEKRMERNKLKKVKVKIVCCIGDILQGSSLMILMLRSDLRIRGLLGLTKMATNIGVDPSK